MQRSQDRGFVTVVRQKTNHLTILFVSTLNVAEFLEIQVTYFRLFVPMKSRIRR